jgi:hypothetical protein
MTLHPSVTLAEGVTIPEEAWHLHGAVLAGGMKNHRIIIRGFPLLTSGLLGISLSIYPDDGQLHLRFTES